jgi:glutathione S-transferase
MKRSDLLIGARRGGSMVAVTKVQAADGGGERWQAEGATQAVSARAQATVFLWSNSPFGYKVLSAAVHKGVPVDVRVASLPDCMEALKRTGRRKTPFVTVGDRWISDSTAICAWLEEQAGPSLWPAGAAARAECALLEDWADEALSKSVEPWTWMVGAGFDRMLSFVVEDQVHRPTAWLFRAMAGWMRRRWQGRVDAHGGAEATRELVCAQLDMLEARLAGRPWLFGDAPTVADFAIAGQLANLVRFDCAQDLDARPAVSAMVRRAIEPLAARWPKNGRPR